MKYSLGGKQSIQFKTDVKGLEEIAPVKPAKYFLPKWFKNMSDYIEMLVTTKKYEARYFGRKGEIAKKHTSGTVKRCPAIVDLITKGYIIPMWADTLVQRDMETLEYDNKNFKYGIEFHGKEQISGWNLEKQIFQKV